MKIVQSTKEGPKALFMKEMWSEVSLKGWAWFASLEKIRTILVTFLLCCDQTP